MQKAQRKRFDSLYRRHLSALKRQGKAEGKKDRYVFLPRVTLEALHTYWAKHRSPSWLFPRGRTRQERHQAREPIDRSGTQKPFKAILADVGIRKNITIQSLRHCYGSLLTDAGVNLRAIQEQMGHECPKTTALYTQLSTYTQTDTDRRINGLIGKLRVVWRDGV